MVKYKNFSSGGHSIGSFSYSTQTSHISTHSNRTNKSKSLQTNDRDPSITCRESLEDDCRDEDGSRFDPRVLSNDSTEDEESESLYDMISYNNGTRDDHSTSVCASYSYSVSVGETDSSAGMSDNIHPGSPRRPKLSYMGYVPMSPNTAAAMAKERKEHSHTRRHSNRNGNNESDHSTEEQTVETGSTFPSVNIDDTSTSRRRHGNYENEEERRDANSFCSGDFSEAVGETNLTEYITVGQQRCLDEQNGRLEKRDSVTVDHNSRFEDATIGTSVVSSVMPNSCTGHPAMKMTNQENQNQAFTPLSPIASPRPSQSGVHDACPISPLSAGTAKEMVAPSLNHPPTMMPPYGYQQPVQHVYGNNQQQQPHQPFQSGFFPRNPVLARQLQAFQQYHSQQQQQEPQEPQPPTSSPSMGNISPKATHVTVQPKAAFIRKEKDTTVRNDKSEASSKSSSQGETTSTEDKPVLIYGADGPRLMNNVKFVTPTPKRSGGTVTTSSSSLIYGATSSVGALTVGCGQNPAAMKCQSYIASLINTCGAIVNHGYHIDNTKASSKEKRAMFGKVAEKSIAGLALSEKSTLDEGATVTTGINSIGTELNDAFSSNAKKILHAGNNLMNTLPQDIQNLTQSTAYQNVFDTFQKYASPQSVDTEETEEIQAKNEKMISAATLSPTHAKREHFRKLRRRYNRGSDNKATSAVLPSDASVTDSVASFQKRYSRNVHMKAQQEKVKARKQEDPPVDGDAERMDDESHCSWATPKSQEAADEEINKILRKPDPLSETATAKETLSGKSSEDVVISTSSGMSESLVGSDIEEEVIESDSGSFSENEDVDQSDEEDEEQLQIESFDHDEFPYTPLDVIEEESEDDETMAYTESIESTQSNDLSVGAESRGKVEGSAFDDTFGKTRRIRTPMKSMIGIVRFMFVAMLAFQCGTIMCLWDQIANQIRTMEGGSQILANAELFVSNLKAGGESLVTTAKDIVNVPPVDFSVEDLFSEIESRTAAVMGPAKQFLSGLSLEPVAQEPEEDADMLLFKQLVGDALRDDDFFQNENEE